MLQRVFTRVSKPAARYSDRGSAAEHCSACRFFMSGGDCARVLGRVLPQGWCKYFSQEAVQRWNPLWPMAGIPAPPGATLDLSFLTSGSLDPRITFTRASTATYTNYAGVMQTAAVNAPRWDYNPSTLALQGLLIEEARTNLFLHSADASQWSANAVTVTANQAIAPDGTLTAASAALTSGGNTNVAQGVVVTANPYAFSVWVKGSAGGEQLYLMGTPDGALYHSVLITATASWQRFSIAMPALTATTWYFQIGVDSRDVSQTTKPAHTVYLWGAQVEQGGFATSYIPTVAASVTRAYDSCYIAPANMSPWFASPGGTWAAEFIAQTPAGATSPRIIGINSGAGITPLWENTSAQLDAYDGAQIATVNTVTTGTISKGASTWVSGTGTICLNSGTVVSGAMTTGFATLATSGVGILGGNPGVINETMTGYIRRARYWPRVLSNAEMQQVTT